MTQAGREERAVLIAGPTASGKSALAMAVAARFGGTVVNVDSMQVYRDLRVLTARPMPAEEARLPHRLYGHVDAAENYSAGRYLADCAAALAELRAAGGLPVLVGGTGLYFKALLAGLSAIPPVPAPIRAAVRLRLAEEGPEALHAALAARDPAAAAAIRPRDPVRIARALEVLEATGRSIRDWRAEKGAAQLNPDTTLRVFLEVDRAELHRRIDARFLAMIEAGALEEVRTLAARGLDPLLPAMKAHGVPALARHLAGAMSLEEAIAIGQRDTRRYAKRQETWFRHQLADWSWLAPEEAGRAILRALGAGGG